MCKEKDRIKFTFTDELKINASKFLGNSLMKLIELSNFLSRICELLTSEKIIYLISFAFSFLLKFSSI